MYCKNCGSIIANNSNFCHVCGAKVEIDDVFDTKDSNNDSETKEETLKDDTVIEDNYNYESKGDFFESAKLDESFESSQDKKEFARKHPRLLSAIALIISLGFLICSGISYGFQVLIYNNAYLSGAINYQEYVDYVISMFTEIRFNLFLGAFAGLALGIPGFLNAKAFDTGKVGKNLAIAALTFASISIVVIVLISIYVGKI